MFVLLCFKYFLYALFHIFTSFAFSNIPTTINGGGNKHQNTVPLQIVRPKIYTNKHVTHTYHIGWSEIVAGILGNFQIISFAKVRVWLSIISFRGKICNDSRYQQRIYSYFIKCKKYLCHYCCYFSVQSFFISLINYCRPLLIIFSFFFLFLWSHLKFVKKNYTQTFIKIVLFAASCLLFVFSLKRNYTK